jgi:hypothetical protein
VKNYFLSSTHMYKGVPSLGSTQNRAWNCLPVFTFWWVPDWNTLGNGFLCDLGNYVQVVISGSHIKTIISTCFTYKTSEYGRFYFFTAHLAQLHWNFDINTISKETSLDLDIRGIWFWKLALLTKFCVTLSVRERCKNNACAEDWEESNGKKGWK